MENDELPAEQQIEELSDDVATVADEILVEVKECRTQQATVAVDLAHLREEGQENSRQYRELLTELQNLREENRSLNQELKNLLSRSGASASVQPGSELSIETQPDSPLSIHSTSQTEAETVISPAAEEGHAAPAKPRKRYKI